MIKTYYIGGSPCSGKSTVTEILAEKYGLYYFRVDDFLDKYIELGAQKGYPICTHIRLMTADETWMREPIVQCEEELLWYQEVFEFVCEDIKKIQNVKGIITEGVAYLPTLMKKAGISANQYLSITPTKEFQLLHYPKREWIPYILKDCSDKEKAFENWMERDVLFAKDVQRQCVDIGYTSLINNGEMSVEEMVRFVEQHFQFETL